MSTENTSSQNLNPQPGTSKAEQEVTELLTSLLQANPLSEAPSIDSTQQEHEGVYTLTSQAAQALNCVAIVRDGKVIPIVDLEGMPEPRTPGQKMHAFALTARTTLDGLMEALAFWEYRRCLREGDQGDEGGPYHV